MSSTGSSGLTPPRGDGPRRTLSADDTPDIPLQKRSRAARLIEQLLRDGCPEAVLSEAIVVNEPMLAGYRAGRVPVPLDRQLCLALYAIEHVPSARRAAFALRAQVEAEIALATDATEVHDTPPISHRWP